MPKNLMLYGASRRFRNQDRGYIAGSRWPNSLPSYSVSGKVPEYGQQNTQRSSVGQLIAGGEPRQAGGGKPQRGKGNPSAYGGAPMRGKGNPSSRVTYIPQTEQKAVTQAPSRQSRGEPGAGTNYPTSRRRMAGEPRQAGGSYSPPKQKQRSSGKAAMTQYAPKRRPEGSGKKGQGKGDFGKYLPWIIAAIALAR